MADASPLEQLVKKWQSYRAQTPRSFNGERWDEIIVARENALMDVFIADLAALAAQRSDPSAARELLAGWIAEDRDVPAEPSLTPSRTEIGAQRSDAPQEAEEPHPTVQPDDV